MAGSFISRVILAVALLASALAAELRSEPVGHASAGRLNTPAAAPTLASTVHQTLKFGRERTSFVVDKRTVNSLAESPTGSVERGLHQSQLLCIYQTGCCGSSCGCACKLTSR